MPAPFICAPDTRAGTSVTVLPPAVIGELAGRALRAEALLTPKPGLVDRRGGGAHDDMTLSTLLRSAEALVPVLTRCAQAAAELPLGPELRSEVGEIGRAGERRMLRVTGGVNTHRGALWALGLLAAGVAARGGFAAADFAARLAALDDPGLHRFGTRGSHGARVRLRYGAGGALAEARNGFPHVVHVALPALRTARRAGGSEDIARIDALLASMAVLEDTCLLYRAGPDGLRAVQRASAAVLRAGGAGSGRGGELLRNADRLCRTRGLSAGGSGDVLAAALFLDSATTPRRRH
ncbi:triphosphoribosyl-dephospho-CoA synthase [Streptomyces bauhiniae]|uniref:triphosphoribosyl-dephospho-CoA synthase n=1 Tax=Streptomyces bauhiniae TaxID=2340725 RepID=A0A7K3QUK7_9ACTN|nr:triphosphoribosyl-dephospho-CoA synthase [Streptomyces bauhiniae]NEB93513.1 triphosphoribosyl-dephospho-CoA synthase MdcB [Streptomyces bauhiniae]